MLMPSIFGEDMFDEFMRDFPFFDERDERRARVVAIGQTDSLFHFGIGRAIFII